MNKKVWAFGVLLCLVWVGACSRAPEVAKREYMRKGDQYGAQKKYKEAVIEYRNAVQQDAGFGEARLKLAEAYEQLGDAPNAFREFIRAADLLPQDVKAQVKAANMLLLARQFEDAKARADKALALDQTNVDAQIAHGNALAGLRDLDTAVTEMEAAIQLDPSRSSTYAILGVIEAARGNRQQAEAAFRKATETDPKSIGARLALANFYWSASRRAEAEGELQAALGLDPKHLVANRAMALFYLGSNQADKAEPYLKTIVEVSKRPSDGLVLANYYASTNRRPEAHRLLEELAKSNSHFLPAKIRLATLAVEEGNRKSAYALIDEALKAQPSNADALAARAGLLADDKDFDQALAAAQDAVKADPRSTSAQYMLGKILSARQQWNDAATAYGEVLKLNPQANGVRLDLARVSLSRGRPDDAIQFAQEALKAQPKLPDATLILGRALMMKGDTATAEGVVRQLASDLPKSALAQAQLGQLYRLKGDSAGARRAFDHALTLEPHYVEALAGLTALDLQAKKPSDARARIEAHLAQVPKDPALQMLAARLYMNLGDTSASERTLRSVIDLDPNQMDAYSMLGQLYAVQNRLEEARVELERLAGLSPSSAIGAHTLVGMILQAQNKPKEAQARYEKVVAMNPRAAVASNNLAWLYAEGDGNLDVALQLAQAAHAQLTDNPQVNDTLGWVYYKKGLSTKAVASFRESLVQAGGNPVYQYHLGLAYAQHGDKQEARKALEQALQLNPKFEGAADVRRLLAEMKG